LRKGDSSVPGCRTCRDKRGRLRPLFMYAARQGTEPKLPYRRIEDASYTLNAEIRSCTPGASSLLVNLPRPSPVVRCERWPG
jgi:hypothetical protein